VAPTQSEIELLGDLVAARDAETGGHVWSLIVEEGYLVDAHGLVGRGWIARRIAGGEMFWRLTIGG
jgi:hypothetical protein